jgi:hypothetical protein
MRELRVTTTQGADTGLEDSVVEAFKASLRGALLRPGDVGYEDTRKIHNGMIDRRPALIACCAGVADVLTGVRFAASTICWYPCAAGATACPGLRCARAA